MKVQSNGSDAGSLRSAFIKRIVSVTVVVNLIFIGVAGLSLYQSWRHYEERTEISTQNLARSLASNLEDAVDKIDLTVIMVAEEVEEELGNGRIDAPSLNAFIARCQTRLPVLDGLCVVNAQGENVYGTGVTPDVRTSVTDRDYFVRLRDNPKEGLVISEPVVGRVSKKWSIILARRINQADGSFAGVAYGAIALDYFTKTFAAINLGKDGSITLRDENLALLVWYPMPPDFENLIGKQNATSELTRLHQLKQNDGIFRSARAFDKIQRTYSFHKVARYPLYVIVGQRPREYLAAWWNEAAWIVALAVLFIVGMVISARLVYRDSLRKTSAVQALAREHEVLLKNQEQHQAILQTAMDGFWLVNKDGQLLEVNETYARMSGYNKQELLGMHVADLVADKMPAEQASKMQSIQTKGEEVFESRHRRKDGSVFDVEVSAQFRPAEGWLVVFLRDITTRKRIEKQLEESNRQQAETLAVLRRTQRQMVQTEQLRGLGQMASGIAHDFNNALSPIIGFSELLLKHPEKLADHALVVKRLQIINTCATDAARVVRQMSDFGRQHPTSEGFQPFNLNQMVLQTVEHTQPRWKDQAQAAGQTIQVVTDLQPVPAIFGEEFAIREVLTNLIFNAVDALPNGGTITVKTMVDGQSVCVAVGDNGVGMTEEIRHRCFEPFYTTKSVTNTGLGLAMVQGVVRRHGGSVVVESELGHGATFIIRLPIPTGK